MRITGPVLLSLMLLSGPAAVQGQEAGDPAAGQRYAERICAECHAVLRDDTESKVAEATAFETIANRPGMSALAISMWLQSTHPTMPNIIVQPEDMNDVAVYIESLKD